MSKKVNLSVFEDAMLSIDAKDIDLCIEAFTLGKTKPKTVFYQGKWGALQECKRRDGCIYWILFTIDAPDTVKATVGYPASFPALAKAELAAAKGRPYRERASRKPPARKKR